VHAVLAWLVVEADVPHDVYLHLVGALLAWAPLMGEHLFPTEPELGVDADLRQVLESMWWRLDAQAVDARWADEVVLNEVRGRIGLALQALRPLRPLRVACPSSAGASVTGRVRHPGAQVGPAGGVAGVARHSPGRARRESRQLRTRRRPDGAAPW